jgi:hypothetical protein
MYQRIQRPRKPILPFKHGHVYLLRIGPTDWEPRTTYKIGASSNLKSRLYFLNIFHLGDTELVWSKETDDAPTLEEQLHTRFLGKWIKSEYFALDESDVAEISSL